MTRIKESESPVSSGRRPPYRHQLSFRSQVPSKDSYNVSLLSLSRVKLSGIPALQAFTHTNITQFAGILIDRRLHVNEASLTKCPSSWWLDYTSHISAPETPELQYVKQKSIGCEKPPKEVKLHWIHQITEFSFIYNKLHHYSVVCFMPLATCLKL